MVSQSVFGWRRESRGGVNLRPDTTYDRRSQSALHSEEEYEAHDADDDDDDGADADGADDDENYGADDDGCGDEV